MHSIFSYEILISKGYSEVEANIVRWHHEAHNGSGYPDGLSGSEIPEESQIISIADYFDAVTSPRPYRPSHLNHAEAIDQVRTLAGSKFTSAVAGAFEAVLPLIYSTQLNSNISSLFVLSSQMICDSSAIALKGGE